MQLGMNAHDSCNIWVQSYLFESRFMTCCLRTVTLTLTIDMAVAFFLNVIQQGLKGGQTRGLLFFCFRKRRRHRCTGLGTVLQQSANCKTDESHTGKCRLANPFEANKLVLFAPNVLTTADVPFSPMLGLGAFWQLLAGLSQNTNWDSWV